MRTNIEIDNGLMKQALQLSELKTKKEVVHQALEHYVRRLKRLKMLSMQGKVKWEGDLNEMRLN
ncbi:MAG: type II toxin-antitoxin system VapB family antitoxin [Phaeodactylibacter sp.]|nr:type II toxin-antitoxin system VapB family antitoxin [Phaeodactylibacter sp.]MCB9053841.1 type II toxin-antitoxin system VapB family antitoxin [Lewinellaceae bacterium]